MAKNDDENICNVFIQKYLPDCDKKQMVGTKDAPFFLVGEFLECTNGNLSVRYSEDSTMYVAPILHKLFPKNTVNISFMETYLMNVSIVCCVNHIITNGLINCTYLLEIGGGNHGI